MKTMKALNSTEEIEEKTKMKYQFGVFSEKKFETKLFYKVTAI